MAMLQKQLKAAGVDPETALLSLDDIKENLQAATRKLMAGDERAQSDFDKWRKFLARIRTILKPLNVLRRSGRKHSAPGTQPRCHICVSFFLMTCHASRKHLETHVGPALARRIALKPVLRMVCMDPSRIAKIHAADLVCKFAFNGLDLREVQPYTLPCLRMAFK